MDGPLKGLKKMQQIRCVSGRCCGQIEALELGPDPAPLATAPAGSSLLDTAMARSKLLDTALADGWIEAPGRHPHQILLS